MKRTVKSARAKTRVRSLKKPPVKTQSNRVDINAKNFDSQDYVDRLAEFFLPFFEGKTANATMGIKSVDPGGLFEMTYTATLAQFDPVRPLVVNMVDVECDWFFRPQVMNPADRNQLTIYGHADTGTVHPTTYSQKPVAWWETLPGHFQAVWRWERPIPIAASTARVEAMLHEFGGVIGSHLPDAYLRIPMCPIYSTAIFPWPVARLHHCAFPKRENNDGPQFAEP